MADNVTDIVIAADTAAPAPRGNCYTVEGGRARHSISADAENVIHVGEAGRGRLLVRVPAPAGSTIDSNHSITHIPTQTETDVVVLIKDHSGYRGDWSLHPARPVEWWIAVLRMGDAHRPPDGHGPVNVAAGHTETLGNGQDDCPVCKAVVLPPTGNAGRAFTDYGDTRVIAQGARAQGIAGHMGGGNEYLLVLAAGVALEIRRRGRLYGDPPVLRVENVAGELVITNPRDTARTAMTARPVW